MDFGPCDWAHHPCVPDFWILTSDCGWVWYGDWYEGLEVGIESSLWLIDWYLMVLDYGWLNLYGCCSVGILVMDSLSYTFVVGYWLRLDESWFMIRSVYCC